MCSWYPDEAMKAVDSFEYGKSGIAMRMVDRMATDELTTIQPGPS
jgi:hypothetical protein